MSGYNSKFGGLKINLKDKVSVKQIVEEITYKLVILQEEFGIEEFSGVNFYCNMYKGGEAQAIISDKSNSMIAGFTSNADKSFKTVTKLEDGSSLYKYDNNIDFKNLESKIKYNRDNSSFNKENYSMMSKSEIEDNIRKNEEEHDKLIKAREKAHFEEKAKKESLEKEKKENLNKFREKFKSDLGISEEEFSIKVSSFALLIQSQAIKKYLGDTFEEGEKFYRVTLKSQKTLKAGDIYIYDINYKLVKEIKR